MQYGGQFFLLKPESKARPCASHSRYFWGLRLHRVCTLHGLLVDYALIPIVKSIKTDQPIHDR
jgi:hypothetical protein